MSVWVETPGLLTTVQDLGRRGYQHLGVGPGGAMDPVSHRLANLLVGNPPGAATLECTLAGPELRFEADALIAICGADLNPTVDGIPLPLWRPILMRAGVELRMGPALRGCRCYLALAGGFQVPRLMGSASTHLAAGFGGFLGRGLKAGDRLDAGPAPPSSYPGLRRRFHRSDAAFLALDWFPPWYRELEFTRPATLRLIPGAHWEALTPAARHTLLTAEFQVAPASDRMGIRLAGPRLALDHSLEPISAGVATGTLQLPPDGAPILLMADRQTTGGYPRIGELATVDLPRAAQLGPGESLQFARTDLGAAQEGYLQREARFRDLERALEERRNR